MLDSVPLDRFPCISMIASRGWHAFRETYEMATMFVVNGHGLIDVCHPNSVTPPRANHHSNAIIFARP